MDARGESVLRTAALVKEAFDGPSVRIIPPGSPVVLSDGIEATVRQVCIRSGNAV